jgi:hypothetical protein
VVSFEKGKKQKGGSEKDWLVIFAVRYVLHIVLSYLRSVITCQALLVEFSSRVVFEFSTSRFFTITIFFIWLRIRKSFFFFLFRRETLQKSNHGRFFSSGPGIKCWGLMLREALAL